MPLILTVRKYWPHWQVTSSLLLISTCGFSSAAEQIICCAVANTRHCQGDAFLAGTVSDQLGVGISLLPEVISHSVQRCDSPVLFVHSVHVQ